MYIVMCAKLVSKLQFLNRQLRARYIKLMTRKQINFQHHVIIILAYVTVIRVNIQIIFYILWESVQVLWRSIREPLYKNYEIIQYSAFSVSAIASIVHEFYPKRLKAYI